MKNTSLEALKGHLFETLEGLKNQSDPEASENEKVTIEQAKAITGVADTIIDIYKTQLDAIKVISSTDLNTAKGMLAIGCVEEENVC